MYRPNVNYIFYIILTEQVLLYSIFNMHVILCGSNRRKTFKSVICASNFFHKNFEEAKWGNHQS
jgi:hypothetical protein